MLYCAVWVDAYLKIAKAMINIKLNEILALEEST